MTLSLAILTTYSLAFKGEESPPKDYKWPIAERPILTPGDYWVYYYKNNDKTTKWEYAGEENGLLVFISRKRKDRLYTTPDLMNIKKIHGKTKEVLYQRDESRDEKVGYLKFPLWVGKKWHSAGISKSRHGSDVFYDALYKVASYETINIPAGSFKALRIERSWKIRGYEDSGSDTVWYAPDAKTIIKYDTDPPSELLEYKVNSQ